MFPKTKVEDVGQKLFSIMIITSSYFIPDHVAKKGISREQNQKRENIEIEKR